MVVAGAWAGQWLTAGGPERDMTLGTDKGRRLMDAMSTV